MRDSNLSNISSVILQFIIAIIIVIFTGIVVADYWFWFFVPLGIPAISNIHAIGISLFIELLTAKPNMATNPAVKGWALLISRITILLVMWGLGAIVHLAM